MIDLAPRPEGLTAPQATALRALAGQVVSQMDLRQAMAERERVLAGQSALIAQQNALISTQAAVTQAAGDRDVILEVLVAGAMAAIPQAEGGVIEMREGDELVYRSTRGTLAAHGGLRLPIDGSLSGHCLATSKPVLCPDAFLDARVKQDLVASLGLRSAVCVPISRGDATVGVLKLQSRRPDAFSGRDVRVAILFAGTVRRVWPRPARPRRAGASAPARSLSAP